jgi:hypothetical protein
MVGKNFTASRVFTQGRIHSLSRMNFTEVLVDIMGHASWMRVAEWLQRLTANAEVATVLASITASCTTQWNPADEAVLNKVHLNNPKNPPVKVAYAFLQLK